MIFYPKLNRTYFIEGGRREVTMHMYSPVFSKMYVVMYG